MISLQKSKLCKLVYATPSVTRRCIFRCIMSLSYFPNLFCIVVIYILRTISLNEALCGYEIPLKHLDGRTLILKNKPGDIITPGTLEK